MKIYKVKNVVYGFLGIVAMLSCGLLGMIEPSEQIKGRCRNY